ncbi:ferritin-like domain-containing protein [Oceanobacillus senegalensis]|uniref:ferritin-like domain-containing protein n=1 Tax=Oceanobacillus senegalensis TaxID=1936063 RepID=UPI000A30A38A|nr:ferritin-like domain-containing protein [Oceanobacillus senegalensis]
MNNEDVIKELNAYLKGEFMGIHSYEHYIQHATDPDIKTVLQRIQREHKEHAAKIAERIQNLGGKAVDDNGTILSIREGMLKLKGVPDTTEDILRNAIKGQEMGMKMTEEIVRGDLDGESKQLVAENLDEDMEHIHQLNDLLH